VSVTAERRLLLDPYVQIGFGAILVTVSELLLKKGAMSGALLPAGIRWLGVGALASGWTWIGIATYLMSFACWLYVLRNLPLSVAFPLINIVQVLVPLAAHQFLGEVISMRRWIGIGCVLCGTVLVARTAARMEDQA